MANFRMFTPTTLAVTTNPFVSDFMDSITVSADNLVGIEVVNLYTLVGGVQKQVSDIYGTPINLTSLVSSVALEGGPTYQFSKGVTASPCAVYVDTKDT